MILNKICEMTYRRTQIKDSIDDHIRQISENWCLIWTAKAYGINKGLMSHWINELLAQLNPGLSKLRSKEFSQKSKYKLIDEVLYEDSEQDDPEVVSNNILSKFLIEGLNEDKADVAAKAWVKEGLPLIRSVYRYEVSVKDLYKLLRSNS